MAGHGRDHSRDLPLLPQPGRLLSALSESVISELCAVVESARDPSAGPA
jgi:hypothetical protein